MAGVAKQIIGSFEDIGRDIARETVKAPKDIVGKALESLGTSGPKGQQGNPLTVAVGDVKKPEGALGQLEQTKDEKTRQAIAREALAQIAGNQKKPKEPTVQERLDKEKQEKNEKEARAAAKAQQMAPIITGSSKPRRGNLYGIKEKSSSEKSKNVRQD